MAKDAKIICPMMGGQECVEDGAIRNGELVKCRFWIHVIGKTPQTNQETDNYDCAMAWMPVLMIENSKVNRETGAAIESMRNENVNTGQQITSALLVAANANKRIEG
jgi:hypothetical protein